MPGAVNALDNGLFHFPVRAAAAHNLSQQFRGREHNADGRTQFMAAVLQKQPFTFQASMLGHKAFPDQCGQVVQFRIAEIRRRLFQALLVQFGGPVRQGPGRTGDFPDQQAGEQKQRGYPLPQRARQGGGLNVSRYGSTSKTYGSMFWAGLPVKIRSFDPWNIELDLNYGYVEEMGKFDVLTRNDPNDIRRGST
ncbi:hypothetical protein [Desulfovibrio sp.]|uniref:hypothetical protein n=1 Tax=Desulfovibrio sp. TaxID=885 RepID=UPI0025C37BCD|nr:hypothetical protein [Desulfovibrio sp.]